MRVAMLARLAPVVLLAAAAAGEPTAPIEKLDAALTQAERSGSAPFAQRYNALAPVIDQVFDLDQILQTSVGLKWGTLPADQKAALAKVFRAYTIANYAANFNSGNDTFKLLPETRKAGGDTIVETEIVPASGGDTTRLDYVMRQGAQGWRVVDVLQTGSISQAAVQRSDFRHLLASGQGAQPLIESLTQKVDTLSGGTIKP